MASARPHKPAGSALQREDPIVQSGRVPPVGWLRRHSHALFGLLTLGVALALSEYVVELEIQNEAAQQQDAMLSFVSQVSSHVSGEMSSTLAHNEAFVSYLAVRHDTLHPDEVNAILEEMFRSMSNVRNISLAIGYRITYVQPIEGNERAIGLDYSMLPDQWQDVLKASQTGHPVLIGPLDLIQGGRGLIYRVPVAVHGSYWGMLSTVFDAAGLLDSVFEHVENDRFELAVRTGWEDEANHKTAVWGPQRLFDGPDAEVHRITLPGGDWEFAVGSRLAPGAGRDILIFRAFTVLIALLLGGTVYLALARHALLGRIALRDPLTGLANRHLLEDRLTNALLRQARNVNTVCVILFIDLDRFKDVNDEHGHRAGDQVLQEMSARVSGALRETDTVGRWGGDEMLVVMENIDRAKIEDLTQRVRQILESPVKYQDKMIRVGASIGCVVAPDDGMSDAELLRLADQRMYEDKRHKPDRTRQGAC